MTYFEPSGAVICQASMLRALLGDEVEHHVAALAAGEVLDGLDVVAVGDHGLVRADLLGQCEGVGVAVDDDDARRR